MRKEVTQDSLRRRRTLFLLFASTWLILAAAWPLSIRWAISRDAPWNRLALEDGVVHYMWNPLRPHPNLKKAEWSFGRRNILHCRNHGFLLPFAERMYYPDGSAMNFGAAVLPLWVPLIPLTLVLILIHPRKCWNGSPNDCEQCGYDLSHNTSGTCPECGTAIPMITTAIGKT